MKISERFDRKRVYYQGGHGDYHYRLINGSLYRFGRFTWWIDGRTQISREKVA